MPRYDFGFRLPVTIKRTRRKGSLQLWIGDEDVRLLVPQTMPSADILQFIEQKRGWIDEHLRKAAAIQAAEPPAREFRDGDRLWWKGQQLPIETQQGRELAFRLHPARHCFQLQLPDSPISRTERLNLIADWYQWRASEYLPDRLAQLAEHTGLNPSGCKVRFYKSRWGSCNRRGLITLNSTLMMAPDAVIDYVLIHELCHLVEHNHSPAYWARVEQWCTNWKQHRRWLKTHGSQLTIG